MFTCRESASACPASPADRAPAKPVVQARCLQRGQPRAHFLAFKTCGCTSPSSLVSWSKGKQVGQQVRGAAHAGGSQLAGSSLKAIPAACPCLQGRFRHNGGR